MQDVTGIGDEAFASTLSVGSGHATTTLTVYQRSALVTVISPAPLASEESLIRRLLTAV
jgi:hypothetical protein